MKGLFRKQSSREKKLFHYSLSTMGKQMTDFDKTTKILFFGDMVGRPGRFAVRDYLSKKQSETSDDDASQFVIANVENASHGFGLTEKNYNEISEYGVDCMTSGNHIWDKKRNF